MFNKKYKYIVSYYFEEGDVTGYGDVTHIATLKANTHENIQLMRESIIKFTKVDSITILNLIKIK